MPRPVLDLPAPLDRKPVIAVTMGEPGGVGPEVIVKTLADPVVRRSARFVVYGLNEMMAYAADLAEIDAYWHRLPHDSDRAGYDLTHDVVVLDYDEYSPQVTGEHKPTRRGGQASMRFLDDAIAATRRPVAEGGVDALVTAPICKESWALAGFRFPGHTELLQNRTRSKRVAMLFRAVNPAAEPPVDLNVVLATIHVPLMNLRNLLTIGAVFDPIDLGHAGLRRLGIAKPRIAVCGLNPHAGENGMFGDEDQRVIAPAVEMARSQGMDVTGPLPADTLFTPAGRSRYDLIVAMYHDQGLIPVKMLAFDDAVNVTLGLPIIRTSVDHGTAFDIAGQNKANAGSMRAAVREAVAFCRGGAAVGSGGGR